MVDVLRLLDDVRDGAEPDASAPWFAVLDQSLARDPDAWASAVGGVGSLSDEHAWCLLAWVEVAATAIVRKPGADAVARAAFALALALQSTLDRRDCAVVASLLRRASILADVDFAVGVATGCRRAGATGREAHALLRKAPVETPPTHREVGCGPTFTFERVAPGFDADDLARWLEGGEQDVVDEELSVAIVAWTGWGSASWPSRDHDAFVTRFGRDRAVELFARVRAAEDDFYGSRAHLDAPNLVAMGEMAAEEFRRARSDISDEAVRALAWCYMYDYK